MESLNNIEERTMPASIRTTAEFRETFAVHAALRHAIRSGLYKGDPEVLEAAQKLVKTLESERSLYGRQLRMIHAMESGITIEQMGKLLRCSRRTLFRYLNHLEAAGIDITLENRQYKVARNLLKLGKG
jgi:biotin operon repressor